MIFMKNMEENIMKYLEFGPFGAVEVETSSPRASLCLSPGLLEFGPFGAVEVETYFSALFRAKKEDHENTCYWSKRVCRAESVRGAGGDQKRP